MKYVGILFILIAVASCGEIPPKGYECYNNKIRCEEEYFTKKPVQYCPNPERQAEFIIACAKAANPMSDEEGEDLVKQCEWTSQNLFCRYKENQNESRYRK